MKYGKECASRIENCVIRKIDVDDCREVQGVFPVSMWRIIIRNLYARADGMEAHMPADPVLRLRLLTELQRCRHYAGMLSELLRGAQ